MKEQSHDVVATLNSHIVTMPCEGSTYAVFYVLAGKHVIAVCQVGPWGKGPAVRPFLSGLHVHADLRRKGVARGLLRYVIQEAAAAGIESLAMWVHKDNKPGDNVFFGRQIGGGK